MVEFKDLIELIKVIAWPVVVIFAFIVFRKPFSQLIEELGRRATKLSVFDFAVELSTVPEFKPTWSSREVSDLRQLSPANKLYSGTESLFEQFRSDTTSDFAVVDLGTGNEWLTSRLYIFASMLERMRGLKCFVFLETKGGVRKRFLGTASPDVVRWALARRYPWLEASFAKSYSEISPDLQDPLLLNDPWISSDHGALKADKARDLVRNFLMKIQQEHPPVSDENNWVTLKNQSLWEHAKWLDDARLERLLGSNLQTSWFMDSPDISSAKRIEAILRRKGPFVALVDEGRIFKSLVDRHALLEQVAADLGDSSDNR